MSEWLTGNETIQLAWPRMIKVGDFVDLNGQVVKVITKQSDLPSMSSRAPYTMFTVVTRDGAIFPADNVHGLKRIWRM